MGMCCQERAKQTNRLRLAFHRDKMDGISWRVDHFEVHNGLVVDRFPQFGSNKHDLFGSFGKQTSSWTRSPSQVASRKRERTSLGKLDVKEYLQDLRFLTNTPVKRVPQKRVSQVIGGTPIGN